MEIIKPEDIKEIITVFNDLIKRNFSGNSAVVTQEEVVEDLYREHWDVVYDKPGYNESYDAFFEFKIK